MGRLRPFALEVYFSQWEFKAQYRMCASDMESMTVNELLSTADDEDKQAWQHLHLGYTETFGSPSLRNLIASTYESVDLEHVLCFAGAQEGIYCAMHALLGPDDHVISIVPNYQSSESVPLEICRVTGVALNPEKNWDLDLQRVKVAIRPNTRLISINFPNNPTGKVISHDAFQTMVEIASRQGIYILSDEVFRLLEGSATMRLPQMADIYDRGLSLNVMSKAYGLPGLRIGWIACKDRKLLQKMECVKHYTSICNSAPSEQLAKIGLKARDRLLERNRGIIDRNLPMLTSFFRDHSELFEWYIPDGGCIGYPKYLGTDGVEEFARRLLVQAGVLLLPASIFRSELGAVPADRLRVGYGRRNLPEGLAAWRTHLAEKAA